MEALPYVAKRSSQGQTEAAGGCSTSLFPRHPPCSKGLFMYKTTKTSSQLVKDEQQMKGSVSLPHRVLQRHEAVAHPPSGRPVPADVGEGLVIVTVGGTEGHLLYGLVHDEVLGDQQQRHEWSSKVFLKNRHHQLI